MTKIEETKQRLLREAVNNSGYDIVDCQTNLVIGLSMYKEEIGCSRSYMKIFFNEDNQVQNFVSDLIYQKEECDFACASCNYHNDFETKDINWKKVI